MTRPLDVGAPAASLLGAGGREASYRHGTPASTMTVGMLRRAATRPAAAELVAWVGARAALRFALRTSAHPSITNDVLVECHRHARAYAKARGWRFRRAIARIRYADPREPEAAGTSNYPRPLAAPPSL